MAVTNEYKILGQADLAATTLTDVYEVPDSPPAQAVLSTVVFCNRTAGPIAIRLALSPAGEAIDPKHYVAFDVVVPASDSLPLTWGITLGAGDIVRAYAAAIDVGVNVFGQEIT